MSPADWMRQYAANELQLTLRETSPEPGKPGGWSDLYRAMGMKMHPDKGHPRADWDRLDEARRLMKEAGWM